MLFRRSEADGRYMNAAKYGLDRVYFGGCFIRGESCGVEIGIGRRIRESG